MPPPHDNVFYFNVAYTELVTKHFSGAEVKLKKVLPDFNTLLNTGTAF
jgi:hypothetical protein